MVDGRMIAVIAEHRRSYLTAQIAIDACVVNEEIALDVLRICSRWICHKNIVEEGGQKNHRRDAENSLRR